MDLHALQQLSWENKERKGFNTTDVPLEFSMLHEKAANAFACWRRGEMNIGEELADVVLYASSIAEMVLLDLDHEVTEKVAKNAARDD